MAPTTLRHARRAGATGQPKTNGRFHRPYNRNPTCKRGSSWDVDGIHSSHAHASVMHGTHFVRRNGRFHRPYLKSKSPRKTPGPFSGATLWTLSKTECKPLEEFKSEVENQPGNKGNDNRDNTCYWNCQQIPPAKFEHRLWRIAANLTYNVENNAHCTAHHQQHINATCSSRQAATGFFVMTVTALIDHCTELYVFGPGRRLGFAQNAGDQGSKSTMIVRRTGIQEIHQQLRPQQRNSNRHQPGTHRRHEQTFVRRTQTQTSVSQSRLTIPERSRKNIHGSSSGDNGIRQPTSLESRCTI